MGGSELSPPRTRLPSDATATLRPKPSSYPGKLTVATPSPENEVSGTPLGSNLASAASLGAVPEPLVPATTILPSPSSVTSPPKSVTSTPLPENDLSRTPLDLKRNSSESCRRDD